VSGEGLSGLEEHKCSGDTLVTLWWPTEWFQVDFLLDVNQLPSMTLLVYVLTLIYDDQLYSTQRLRIDIFGL